LRGSLDKFYPQIEAIYKDLTKASGSRLPASGGAAK